VPRDGHRFLVAWCAARLMFAIVVFSISMVSFAPLIDRRVLATDAILTSLRVTARNPLTMALWGLICASLLAAAIAPFFSRIGCRDAGTGTCDMVPVPQGGKLCLMRLTLPCR
jgi:hypothetical protein